MNKKVPNDIEEKIKFFEKSYFLVLLVALIVRSFNVFSLLPSKYDSIVFGILGAVGALIAIYEGVTVLSQKKVVTSDWLLVIFLLVFFISSIINRQYGLGGNIKLLAWNAVYILGLYLLVKRLSKEDTFFQRIDWILIIGTFIMSLISIGMYLIRFSYVYVYGPGPRDHIRIGFLESRLFGIYGDPNFGATTAVIVLILSIFYLVSHWKLYSKLAKGFLFFNSILQYCYILLSGSRSALLLCYLSLVLVTFAAVFSNKKLIKAGVLKKIILSMLAIVVVGICFTGIQSGSKIVLAHVSVADIYPNAQKKSDKADLTRKDVANNDDISNMRFSIWQSGIEIFKTSPIFGVSPRNLFPYAVDKLPKTYIAKKKIVTHNTFINLLASTGVLGFVSIMAYFIFNAYKVFACLFKKKPHLLSYPYLYTLIVIVIAASGFFNNEFILVNTIGTLVFWLYLGRLNLWWNSNEDLVLHEQLGVEN